MHKLATTLAALAILGCSSVPKPESAAPVKNTLEIKVFYEERISEDQKKIYCDAVKEASNLLLGTVKERLPSDFSLQYGCDGSWKSLKSDSYTLDDDSNILGEFKTFAKGELGDLNIGIINQFATCNGLADMGGRFAIIDVESRSGRDDYFTKVIMHELGHLLGLAHIEETRSWRNPYDHGITYLVWPLMTPGMLHFPLRAVVDTLTEEEKKVMAENLNALLAYNHLPDSFSKAEFKEKIIAGKRYPYSLYFSSNELGIDKADKAGVFINANGSYNILLSHKHKEKREDELKHFLESQLSTLPKEKLVFYTTEPTFYDYSTPPEYVSTVIIPSDIFIGNSSLILSASTSAGFVNEKEAKYLDKIVALSKAKKKNPYAIILAKGARGF